MKKIICIVICCLFMFSLASCSCSSNSDSSSKTTQAGVVSNQPASETKNNTKSSSVSNVTKSTEGNSNSETKSTKFNTMFELIEDKDFKTEMTSLGSSVKTMLNFKATAESDDTLLLTFKYKENIDSDIKDVVEKRLADSLKSSMGSILKAIKSVMTIDNPKAHLIMKDKKDKTVYDKVFEYKTTVK